MNDLVEFLHARRDEDRSLAQQALDTPATDVELYATWPRQRVPFGMTFDPARALAEVERDRRLLDLHAPGETEYVDGDVCMTCEARGEGPYYPCLTLRLLALPYADHPDYREEWRPQIS